MNMFLIFIGEGMLGFLEARIRFDPKRDPTKWECNFLLDFLENNF